MISEDRNEEKIKVIEAKIQKLEMCLDHERAKAEKTERDIKALINEKRLQLQKFCTHAVTKTDIDFNPRRRETWTIATCVRCDYTTRK